MLKILTPAAICLQLLHFTLDAAAVADHVHDEHQYLMH